MCGIAGIHNLNRSAVELAPLRRMIGAIRHRGPDADGYWAQGPTGFGHARLAIIDLEGGAQPMANPARTLWITFNGEIFNYPELRADLVARGHRFETDSDTEVILHLYEEKGEACVEDLNGQWAFAIWDKRRQKLFLSRDRMGIRPLYYTVSNGRLLFASEVKGLFAHPAVSREIDPKGLDETFTFWCCIAPQTPFRGIRQLAPGACLRVEEGKIETWRYWHPAYHGDEERSRATDFPERLRELLIDATRLRLRADVPVGAYLSGGLDSSVIAAIVKNYTDTPLKTYSVRFEDAEFDERGYQQQVVDHLGTDHRHIDCAYRDIGEVFRDVIWHAESGVVRTGPAPLYLLSRLVRENDFKVVLTGEGADEVLGGYDIFKEAKIRRFWAVEPDSEFRPLLLKRLYPYMKNIQAQPEAYRRAFFDITDEALASPLFSHLPRWNMSSALKRFYSRATRAALDGVDLYAEVCETLPAAFSRWSGFEQAQYLETTILLPGYILSSQGDRMAMGHSVEGRFPFLDHRVVEFASSVPSRLKMKVLNEKHLLKQALGGLVPASVGRRAKQPYRAPDAVSLMGNGGRRPEYVDALLAPERLRADGLFDPRAVERLLRKFEAGRAIGIRDNMALVGILSTQILVDSFVNHFRA